MRLLRFLLPLLLPLLLLFAQQEALVHELGHYGKAMGQTLGQSLGQAQSPHKQGPASKSCEKCVVFAHIAGAAPSEAPQLLAPALAYDHPQQLQVASIAAAIVSPRSRGPPGFL